MNDKTSALTCKLVNLSTRKPADDSIMSPYNRLRMNDKTSVLTRELVNLSTRKLKKYKQ